jgi:DNA-binding MarR family transcriptional regulator
MVGGMSERESLVFAAVAEFGETGATISRLAEATDCAQGDIRYCLDRFIQHGLVERLPGAYYRVTASGADYAARGEVT